MKNQMSGRWKVIGSNVVQEGANRALARTSNAGGSRDRRVVDFGRCCWATDPLQERRRSRRLGGLLYSLSSQTLRS